MQEYLSNYEVVESRTVLRYRIHMSQYSANFKGLAGVKLCHLCGSHEDRQDLSFSCPEVMKNLVIRQKYKDIFSSKISSELVKDLMSIEKIRLEKK